MPKLKPLYSQCIPQLSLPEKHIGTLKIIFEEGSKYYEVQHKTPFGIINKVANGKYVFAIRVAEPEVIYCFSEKIVRRPELATRVTHNLRNYGHSSLGYMPEKEGAFLSKPDDSSWKEYFATLAMPMLLAGNAYFNDQGEMMYWSVESGHYLPKVRDAFANRVGVIKEILPYDKFAPILFNHYRPKEAIPLHWKSSSI